MCWSQSSLLVRFTDSDYPFGIFKLFSLTLLVNKHVTQVFEIYICDNTFGDSCLFENDTSFDFQNFGSNSKLLNIKLLNILKQK